MRFLRYALGEILLVVAGILIALQINNWNEERIEQAEIREYALNLSAAIATDMQMLDPVEMQIRTSVVSSLVDVNFDPDAEGMGELNDWPDGFTQADVERRLTKFRETKTFARLASSGRSLLSRDPARFGYLANLNLDYSLVTRAKV